MVIVTGETAQCRPKLESLTHVDVRRLSQSELRSLALHSVSAFDLHSQENVVTPQIDRCRFNESAGSQQQTYSGHRKPAPLASDDAERLENRTIVRYLKQHIEGTSGREIGAKDMHLVGHGGQNKRKRGTKPKMRPEDGGCSELGENMEIINKNGAVVDIWALERAEDPYGEEFRSRTAGLDTEPELLEFMRLLDGQWVSRREKRRIVDASDFGDWLPVGWKLLLALRRKEGRVWIDCRRYISPKGQQFVSCKEVASYLQTYFGLEVENNPRADNVDSMQQINGVSYECLAGTIREDENVEDDSTPISAIYTDYKGEAMLLEFENLTEVEVHDIFECHICKVVFKEKLLYSDHLLGSHGKTTRRYSIGTSVGDGVIIGPYRCQICPKSFEDEKSYDNHVNMHVRNEELPNIENRNDLPSGFSSKLSKMAALIEIAEQSILETSFPTNKLNQQDSECILRDDKLEKIDEEDDVVTSTINSGLDTKKTCSFTEAETSDGQNGLEIIRGDIGESGVEQGVIVKTESRLLTPLDKSRTCGIDCSLIEACFDDKEHPQVGNMETHGNQMTFENDYTGPSGDVVMESLGQPGEENLLHNEIADPLMPPNQSFESFSSFGSILDKVGLQGEDNFSGIEIEPLRFSEIGSLKFDFEPGEEGFSVPQVSTDLGNKTLVGEIDSSLRFESETTMLNMTADGQEIANLCMWCEREFKVGAEGPSSFMCPSCKDNISG